MKGLPPIARRDEQIKVLRAYTNQLQKEVRRLGGRSLPPPVLASVGRPLTADLDEQASAVRESGLFDEGWYRSQLEPGTLVEDPVRHYLRTGHRQGLSATPFLAEAWYRSHLAGAGADAPPLLHYLRSGTAGAVPVHPAFPIAGYVDAFPESRVHRGGPLGHYLDRATTGDKDAAPAAVPGALPPAEFAHRARRAAEHLRQSRGYEHLPRQSGTWDEDAELAFKAALLEDASLGATAPLVSVVLPTRNRAESLRSAISSVLAQSYGHWELIVVDDGSEESLEQVRADLADPRVRWIEHEVNRGVAAARNTALGAARGRYVAYLDSDNTWRPDFLEVMVRHLHRTGAPVGYAATALIEQGGKGRRLYRGMPFSRGALRERNYIDCIVVVHERSLLDRVGGFDEALRRTVDWDLLIRLAEVADFSYAPFIGSEYDLWEEGGERITTDVAEGYRFRVRERTLVDWERARRALADRSDHLSVVVAATRPADEMIPMLERLLAHSGSRTEVVVVDDHLAEGDSIRLFLALDGRPQVQLHRLSQRLPPELARNVGIVASTGRDIILLDDRALVFPGWHEHLVDALEDHVAVQPVVLGPSGAVLSAGVSFAAEGLPSHTFQGWAGDAPEIRGSRRVDALTGACLAVRAADVVAVEGLDPLVLRDELGPELSLRLRRRTGGSVACIGPGTIALTSVPDHDRGSGDHDRHNRRQLRQLWRSSGLEAVPEYGRAGLGVAGYLHPGPGQLGAAVPVLVRERPAHPLRWAIKTGIYSISNRDSWGDWHFALSLREALERRGHVVTVDLAPAWYRPTTHLDDVVLVLQGRGRYLPSPGQLNALWVYSHPSEAPMADVADFDLVLGASEAWCRRARPYARTTPVLLRQCTDPDRFYPGSPLPGLADDVLMVGNARGMRPSVQAALDSGVVPAVYGLGWDGLLPEGAVRGTYLPNDRLRDHYVSAGVVLNDHWDEMRQWGLLSNRLFDLAACGARVISDDVDGLAEVFGDVVLTYRDRAGFEEALRLHAEEDEDRRARRRALSRTVRTEHSFEARAETLESLVQEALRVKRLSGGR